MIAFSAINAPGGGIQHDWFLNTVISGSVASIIMIVGLLIWFFRKK